MITSKHVAARGGRRDCGIRDANGTALRDGQADAGGQVERWRVFDMDNAAGMGGAITTAIV
jgi:hypothetical protein